MNETHPDRGESDKFQLKKMIHPRDPQQLSDQIMFMNRLLEEVRIIAWEADVSAGHFVYVSPQAEKILGYPIEDWYTKDFWFKHIHPDDREYIYELCLINSQHLDQYDFEYRMLDSEGRAVWFHDLVTVLRENDVPKLISGYMIDITKKKSESEELYNIQKQLQQIVDGTSSLIYVKDLQGKYLLANKKFQDFFDLSLGDILGRTDDDLFESEQALSMKNNDMAVVKKMTTIEMDEKISLHNKLFYFLITKFPLINQFHKVYGVCSIATDITHRREFEISLQTSESSKNAIVESSLDGIISIDELGLVTEFNPAAENMFNYKKEEVLGKNISDYIVPFKYRKIFQEKFKEYIIRSISCMVCEREEFVLMRAIRKEFRAEVSISCLKISEKIHFIGFFRDITESSLSKEALKQSHSLLQATLESTADGILVVDRQGLVKIFNQKFMNLWRISDNLIKTNDDSLLLSFVSSQLVNPDSFLEKVKDLYDHPERESFDIINFKDGRILERVSLPQKINNEIVGRVWSFRDVTENRNAQQHLRHSMKDLEMATWRARFLSQASKTLVKSLDYEKTLENVSQMIVPELGDWCLLGLLESDGSARLLSVVADVEKADLAKQLESCRPDLSAPEGIPRVLRTGKSALYTDITLDQLYPSEDMMPVVGTNDPEHLATMRQLGLVSYMAVPFIVRGQPFGAVMIASSHKQRQYNEEDLFLVEELAQRCAMAIENSRLYSESLRSIQVREDFISIAAHELRTPLTPLKMQLYLLKKHLTQTIKDLPQGEILDKYIHGCDEQLNRFNRLIENMLDVSRITRGQINLHYEEFNLSHLIKEVVERYHVELNRAKCAVNFDLDESIVGKWDKLRIEQVVINLLTNAIKYGAGNKIEIKLWKKARNAFFSVRDYGIGIDKKDHVRIFDRFERAVSLSSYEGLGLGLYITEQIIRAHSGSIRLESEINKGAKFIVRLNLGS